MARAVEDLLHELAPQVLGVLARQSGDFDAAEDAVQEALIAAADHWPREGVPDNPRAWLLRTAGRRLIDQRRSEQARDNRELRTAVDETAVVADAADDTLTVLFLCSHPSLTPASAIALTLRAVGGLTTRQIAQAFLVPEATMAQRISRAKATIKASGAGFAMPGPDDYPATLRNVLHVLYLMFNEGYVASDGDDLGRTDLADEAIRVARLVHAELPDDAEAAGLLALMLLVDARRPARTTSDGEPIPLAEQDRSRWDRSKIAEGTALIDLAIGHGRVGEYQLQAAIAALHDRAPTATDTDWPQIGALYELLERMTGSPVVTVNRAVAVAMADDPAAGLAILDGVDGALAGSHRVAAVRGHLLEMAGDLDGAAEQYQSAAGLTTNLAEQRHLSIQAARLRAQG
jgi:RNA polymerase sigma factor (sigma-70 family)